MNLFDNIAFELREMHVSAAFRMIEKLAKKVSGNAALSAKFQTLMAQLKNIRGTGRVTKKIGQEMSISIRNFITGNVALLEQGFPGKRYHCDDLNNLEAFQ